MAAGNRTLYRGASLRSGGGTGDTVQWTDLGYRCWYARGGCGPERDGGNISLWVGAPIG